MNAEEEKQKIREVIATWMRATVEGDLERVLSLMAEDVVFLFPGQPPMRGREAFAAASRSAVEHVRIEGLPEIQEIHIAGDYAFCWNHLSVTMTPLQGGAPKRREGRRSLGALSRCQPAHRGMNGKREPGYFSDF
jgi:uncharacterized protein (TIGR02246 family)